MTVVIRKLHEKQHEYFAYTKSLCGKATYFVYFKDNIWGAVNLCNFIEMLRSFFNPPKVKVLIAEKDISFQNDAFLHFLKADSTEPSLSYQYEFSGSQDQSTQNGKSDRSQKTTVGTNDR